MGQRYNLSFAFIKFLLVQRVKSLQGTRVGRGLGWGPHRGPGGLEGGQRFEEEGFLTWVGEGGMTECGTRWVQWRDRVREESRTTCPTLCPTGHRDY